MHFKNLQQNKPSMQNSTIHKHYTTTLAELLYLHGHFDSQYKKAQRPLASDDLSG